MSKALMPYVGAAAAVVAMALYANHLQQAQAADAPTDTPAVKVASSQLRYPTGSPQLDYLNIAAVQAEVPPVMEPLPARLTFNEDHTEIGRAHV